jgi:hypothetical protein
MPAWLYRKITEGSWWQWKNQYWLIKTNSSGMNSPWFRYQITHMAFGFASSIITAKNYIWQVSYHDFYNLCICIIYMRRLIMISSTMYIKEMPMCKKLCISSCRQNLGWACVSSHLSILQIIFCLHNMLRSRVGPPVVILLSRPYNNK